MDEVSGAVTPVKLTTDQQADSVVDYGETALYGSVASDLTLTTSHSITLTNLSQGTLYHFMVSSNSDKNVLLLSMETLCQIVYIKPCLLITKVISS